MLSYTTKERLAALLELMTENEQKVINYNIFIILSFNDKSFKILNDVNFENLLILLLKNIFKYF